MKRILCIWLPHWPLQRLFLAQPELKRRAVTLYEQNRGLRVVLSNQQGVAPGMPLAEATAHGALHLEPYAPELDRAALRILAQECELFSPLVGLEETDRPECLYLDVTGLAMLFCDKENRDKENGGEKNGEENLLRQIAQALHGRGLFPRIALADTLGAAWALAHFGDQDGHAAPCDRAGILIPPGGAAAALAPLPLPALRLPAAIVATLHELGVERIAQLCALPRASLAARFDRQLLLRIHQALGEVSETIVAHRTPAEISFERQLEYPLERRDAAEFVVGELIRQACGQLLARQHGVIQLECTYCCSGRPLRAVVGLFQPSANAGHLLALLQTRLERIALPGPVSAIRIAVLLSAPLEIRQRDLFGEDRAHDEHFAPLVDRLSSRLGPQAVTQPTLVADAHPAFSVRGEPLAGRIRKKPPRPKRPNPAYQPPNPVCREPPNPVCHESPNPVYHGPLARATRQPTLHRPDAAASNKKTSNKKTSNKTRPLLLEPGPLPLEVSSVIPAGPPVSLQWRNRHHRVAASWGPERIQTGWWRGHSIRRDYYRIETDTVLRHWIFRRHDGRWFLHGAFD
jgi:protein ImuB